MLTLTHDSGVFQMRGNEHGLLGWAEWRAVWIQDKHIVTYV